MRRSVTCLIVLAGLLLATDSANAGAWTQSRGHGFYKLGGQLIRATQFYEPDGTRITIPTFGDYTTSVYGEYGLTQRVTVVTYIPFVKRITLNKQVERTTKFVFFPGDAKTGIADSDLGVRIGLIQDGATVVSAGLMLGFPIGDHQQVNGLRTGDGEFNQFLTLQAGHSFYPVPLYVTGEVGVNNRSDGYSDELRYAVEAGYTVRQRVTLSVHARAVESFKNGESTVTGGMGGLYANNQRYFSYGPELSVLLTNAVGLTAGVDGAARGQNVLAAPMYSLGISMRL